MVYLLNMVIFYSYVKLPEGNTFGNDSYRDHSTKFHVFDVCWWFLMQIRVLRLSRRESPTEKTQIRSSGNHLHHSLTSKFTVLSYVVPVSYIKPSFTESKSLFKELFCLMFISFPEVQILYQKLWVKLWNCRHQHMAMVQIWDRNGMCSTEIDWNRLESGWIVALDS